MILFFEGKEYKRELLERFFGKDHTKVITTGNLKDGKAVLDCVGYYYNPKLSHIFILPKVFIINGKGFGNIEIKDNEPITDTDNLAQALKDQGWASDIITDLPIYLYRGIDKYRRRKHDTSITELDHSQNILTSIDGKKETSLMDIVLSLRDFYSENQNLFVLTYKQIHSGFNKVSWNKTIRKHSPLIRGEKVVYPFVVNHRKQINYDEELLVLLFNSLRYINNEYHFNTVIDQPYNLLSDKEFKKKLNSGIIKKRLLTIKYNYFNEKLVQLWDLLYLFAAKSTHIRNEKEKEEYLLVRDFNKVFEDMIDTLLGDPDVPKSLLKQKDGKIVDHLFKGLSLTTVGRPIYYVGDSKYYKENSLPVGDALFKQYTYAKNIIQTQLDWYQEGKPHLKYRDELTEGYNITPNFFISGCIKKDYIFTSHELELQEHLFKKNSQFKNRLFDRDTLFLRQYDINFLYVLYAYVNKSQSIRVNFRNEAKETFRRDFISYIDQEYDFYLIQANSIDDTKKLLDKHFRILNGKIFCPYEKQEVYYGLIMLGLERDCQKENAELLTTISKDFIIKEYHLGTEPYLYHNGFLHGKEYSRTMTLSQSMIDDDGSYRKESVIIGCYSSIEELESIKQNRTFRVPIDNGKIEAEYTRAQQAFTASMLLLFDSNDPLKEATCYSLSTEKQIVNEKQQNEGGSLCYFLEGKHEGKFSIKDFVEKRYNQTNNKAIYLYFIETESIALLKQG